MASMLEFQDVELYYDHVYALKGVSLALEHGETVAQIGANGAGKSSILRAITEFSVQIDGQPQALRRLREDLVVTAQVTQGCLMPALLMT